MVLRKRPGGAEEPMVAKPKVEEDRRGQLADHGGLGLNSGLTVHSGLKSGLGLTAHSWQTGGDSTVDHGHKLNPFRIPKKQKPTLFYLEKVIMSGFRTPIGIGITIPHLPSFRKQIPLDRKTCLCFFGKTSRATNFDVPQCICIWHLPHVLWRWWWWYGKR